MSCERCKALEAALREILDLAKEDEYFEPIKDIALVAAKALNSTRMVGSKGDE